MNRRRSRSRSPRGHGGNRQAPPAAPAFGWPYGGYPGGAAPPSYGHIDPAQMAAYYMQQMGGEKKKKKKKKKRNASSSSSSSGSRNDPAKAWAKQMEMWQQSAGGGWPQMMPGSQAPGGAQGSSAAWPPAPPAPPSEAINAHHGGRDDGYRDHDYNRGRDRSPGRQEAAEDIPIFLEAAIEEYVPVPKALLGKIIGKQAATIIEIREKSGAFKVDARDQTADPCMVKIAGTAEAVKKARDIIMDLLSSTKKKHDDAEYVEIPKAKIGMVIGLKGAQVNEIQCQTGTKVDVDFTNDPCRCYIKGPPENVAQAKKVLLTIAMQIEDEESEYIDLPKNSSGALIGAQGSRIRQFQEQSGARIDVDKTGQHTRVRFSGTREQVANAKQLVMAEVENNERTLAATPSIWSGPSHSSQPMIIPAHQPDSFPATLAESIARAKAAAEAVNQGLQTGTLQLPAITY